MGNQQPRDSMSSRFIDYSLLWGSTFIINQLYLEMVDNTLSEEHKSKIGLANRGRKASEDTRRKLSESHKGIPQSEESKRKRSESIKLWWTKRKSVEDIVKS